MKSAVMLLTLCFGLLFARHAQCAPAGSATPANPRVWEPRVKSVSVFKSGLGFFLRESEVSLRDGWCVAHAVPPAMLGTLAIYSLDTNSVVDVVGSGQGETVEFDGHDAPDTLDARRSFLASCTNLSMSLVYTKHDAQRTACGTLTSVDGAHAILDGNDSTFAVPLAAITKAQVLELPLRVHVAGGVARNRVPLGMAHLQTGITWIPEYSLKVRDNDTAELTLRGTLVNDAEDLVDCDVNFIVGSPRLAHTEFLSPLALGQTIRTIGAATSAQPAFSQVMNQAALFNNGFVPSTSTAKIEDRPVDRTAGLAASLAASLPSMSESSAGDYTVYRKQHITIRRGEKMTVTLLVATVRYARLYRWTTCTNMSQFIVLKNTGASSWTTGPCLAFEGDKPLAENVLKYTPAGGRAELEVSAGINVAHSCSEAETNRQLKAYNAGVDSYYDLVTIVGTITLKNFDARPCEVDIVAPVPGKPTEATDGGTTVLDASRLVIHDRAGTVHWRLNLATNETKVLHYSYDRHVRSQ